MYCSSDIKKNTIQFIDLYTAKTSTNITSKSKPILNHEGFLGKRIQRMNKALQCKVFTTEREKSILNALYMNMQKYELKFYLLINFQLL